MLSLIALACTPTPPAPAETGSPAADSAAESGVFEEIESIRGEAVGVFDPTVVHTLLITLDDAAIDALRAAPTDWVEGDIRFDGLSVEGVGLRLKGSSSFQTIDGKPAWKIKLGEYREGQELHGLERLTLNNEVHDPTMMAETMSYRVFRELGAPAPQTGYAAVALNGEYLGLYAIIESMDDDFMARTWPGSEGGLWEMTRNCDFDSDCSCFDLQETGDAFEEDGIERGCEAVAAGSLEALQSAFDWEALVTFLAVELSVNHPDSYSYNLNNFFVHHDPLADRLSLIPWGADSTFVYATPASTDNPDCQPLYRDVLEGSPVGWLASFCASDATCRAMLHERIADVADWMEESDLVGQMQAQRALLDPYAALETSVNWTVDDRQRRVACFEVWTAQRPDQLRAWMEGG